MFAYIGVDFMENKKNLGSSRMCVFRKTPLSIPRLFSQVSETNGCKRFPLNSAKNAKIQAVRQTETGRLTKRSGVLAK
jgi:hypothetical protein